MKSFRKKNGCFANHENENLKIYFKDAIKLFFKTQFRKKPFFITLGIIVILIILGIILSNRSEARNTMNKKYVVVFAVIVRNNGPNTAENVVVNSWLNHTYYKY